MGIPVLLGLSKIGLAKRCQVHCEIGPLKTTPVAECLALMKAIESPRRVPGCSGFSVSRCFQDVIDDICIYLLHVSFPTVLSSFGTTIIIIMNK